MEVFHLDQYADEVPKNTALRTAALRFEIVRALSEKPKLLLLDEPAAGLNSVDIQELIRLVRWIHETFDVTIWMIEHHMDVMMELCQRIKVIDFRPDHCRREPRKRSATTPAVITAYLGNDKI